MEYFFMVIDYLVPILMIVSYPWWKRIAKSKINRYSGIRTSLSMKNQESWEKANLLFGKYSFRIGIILFVFVFIMRCIKVFPLEWNSLAISIVHSIVLIVLPIVVNNKLEERQS